MHRYTLGLRIDHLFVETMEAIAAATYLTAHEKFAFVRLAARKLDTVKVLLLVLWETRSLKDNPYIEISRSLETSGKMLGGWIGQLQKKNKLPENSLRSPTS